MPDAALEALRDLVRAWEAAKQDELRARHRLSKFLLRHGRRAPMGVKAWTMKYLEWIRREVHFEQIAQKATLLDYLHEVEHRAARIVRLESAITEAVKSAPPQMRAVIEALQALRGIAHVSASQQTKKKTVAQLTGHSISELFRHLKTPCNRYDGPRRLIARRARE